MIYGSTYGTVDIFVTLLKKLSTKELFQVSQLCLSKFKVKSTPALKASGAISIFVTDLNC